MKRKDEEYCRTKFDEFLSTRLPSTQIVWREVPQAQEPPDYYVLLNGSEYAVEVTILMERRSVGTYVLPEAAITNSLWDFVGEVEQCANESGYLQGTYLIDFSSPIGDFRLGKDEIKAALLKYIHDTQSLSQAEKEFVSRRGSQSCSIRKFHNDSDKVLPSVAGNLKWEGDSAIDICNILNERISVKERLLKKINHPKVLLLLDAYHFASPQMFKDCIGQLSSLTSFHTVFVARSGGEGFVLYSQDKDW
jgi:hypothetical protein